MRILPNIGDSMMSMDGLWMMVMDILAGMFFLADGDQIRIKRQDFRNSHGDNEIPSGKLT